MPLTSHVRVDLPTVRELVADIREDNPAGPLVTAAEAVEDAVRHAQPVPLTDQVRLPRDHVEELVQALRTAAG